MPLTSENVSKAAAQQGGLLDQLAQTDWAKSALEQTNARIEDLDGQIPVLEKKVKLLGLKTSQEHAEHKDLQESTMRRLAHKLSGQKDKFEAKTAQREKEFFEALQEEKKAKGDLEMLREELSEAKETKSSQEAVMQLHTTAQADLDALYNALFEGATPDFPEEDEKEQALRDVRESYWTNQGQLDADAEAVKILGQAVEPMIMTITRLSDAASMSTFDLFGGGLIVDSMERNELAQAQSWASRTEAFIAAARRVSPRVGDIGPIPIASGHIMSDVIFDNIFTDLAFHEKIERSNAEAQMVKRRLEEQISSAKLRVSELTQKSTQLGAELEAARLDLQNYRTEAVLKLVKSG